MYNAYKFVTSCRAPAPIPCPARRCSHRPRFPPRPRGSGPRCIAEPPPSSAPRQRSRTPPRQEQKLAGTRTGVAGGDTLSPRLAAPLPAPSLPGAAGRGGSARLRGGGGGRPLPPDTPALSGATPGLSEAPPQLSLSRGSARQGEEAARGVPPASQRSLCRVFSPSPLLLSF